LPTLTDSPPAEGFLGYHADTHDIHAYQLHGRPVTFAFSKHLGLNQETEQEWVDFVKARWLEWWDIFQGFPFPSYTIVFGGDELVWTAGAKGVGFEIDYGWLVTHTGDAALAHEIFHAWLPNSIVVGTGRLEEKWFNEGVTEYYGYRGCGPVRTVESLRGALDYYQRALEAGQDMPLDQAGQLFGTERSFFYYAKGALVALVLDRELDQNYGLSLDDVLRTMYNEYGIYGGVVTNDDILRILNQVTGEDLTDFFNKYVYGAVELPLTEQDLVYVYH